jgi:integrase
VRSRHITDTEFLKLWNQFKAEGDPHHGAFALLAYTGARRREVTDMTWDEVDLDALTWTLPPERRKTGRKDPEPFVITLHAAAVEIIKRQAVLEGSPFVFWGRRDRRPFDFQHSLLDRIKETAGVKDWRLHDIRRFVRSHMGRLGVTQAVAEMCLGHIAKGGLVGVYDRHSYSDEKAQAWRHWGDWLAKLTGPK